MSICDINFLQSNTLKNIFFNSLLIIQKPYIVLDSLIFEKHCQIIVRYSEGI